MPLGVDSFSNNIETHISLNQGFSNYSQSSNTLRTELIFKYKRKLTRFTFYKHIHEMQLSKIYLQTNLLPDCFGVLIFALRRRVQ